MNVCDGDSCNVLTQWLIVVKIRFTVVVDGGDVNVAEGRCLFNVKMCSSLIVRDMSCAYLVKICFFFSRASETILAQLTTLLIENTFGKQDNTE